jgi:intracellular septation protein
MKFLSDMLPVILFFIAFKVYDIYAATVVAIVTTALQIAWSWYKHRKVENIQWISLALIVVFGGATLLLHDENFIKWKPTILYWLFGGILLGGRLGWNRNFVRSVLGAQITVPEPVWEKLLWMWIVFFAAVGTVNIAVAYSVPTATWVNFKLFGLMGLTFAFTIGMGFWLARHMPDSGGERG